MVFTSPKEEGSNLLNNHDHHHHHHHYHQNSPNNNNNNYSSSSVGSGASGGGGFKFSLSNWMGAKSKLQQNYNNTSTTTTTTTTTLTTISSIHNSYAALTSSSSESTSGFLNNNNNGTPRRKISSSNPKVIPLLNTEALIRSNLSPEIAFDGCSHQAVDHAQTKLYSIIHELQLNVNFNQGMSNWNGYFDVLYENVSTNGSPGIISTTPRGNHHIISQSMPYFPQNSNPNSPSSSLLSERTKGLRNLVMGKSMNNLEILPSSTMSQFDAYLMKKERKLLQKFGRFPYVKGGISPLRGGSITPRTPRTPRASPLVIMRPKENSNNLEELVLDGVNLIPSPRPNMSNSGFSTPRGSISERSFDDSPISDYSIDDVTFLDRPTTENITNLLESRYNRKDQTQKKSPLVYSYLGDALIFVNPNDIKETEGLYKNSVMHFYHKKLPFARAPHIFSIAENAFRTMKETRQPQTIVVNGESGSGKTESSKLILKYLTVVSQNGPSSYFVKHVLTESNQLLEAFGNAKTMHCDNSSRFGKYTTVYFGFGDRIEGGKISTILLEKSHITNQRKKERNFHIFYQLCRGADKSIKEEFNLHDPSEFLYLNSTETVIDGVDDMKEFKKTIKSMDSIGFSSNDRKEVFRIVAGILHLGNIQFIQGNVKDKAEIVENDALKWASLCLGVQPNQLKHALLTRTLNTEERVVTFQNAVQARFNRDALAKGIYERLFLWIVQKINSVIKPKTKKMVTKIGILDLYGFEIYPSDNSLEQLNINFVNEKLQQHTLKLLQQEKDEYIKEGIFNMDLFTILSKELKKDFLSDFDTINDCISCIEDQPLGIYSLLDEEDYLNGSGGDERYLTKLKENLKKSNSFEPARFKSTTFSLKHFAAKVDYNVTDWVKKNKDTLFKDLIDSMCKSSSNLVQELFKPLDDYYLGRESKRRLQETIVKQFKRDVNKLMNKKLKGKIHFVYCIKPNYEKKALKFDKKTISNQVKCLGLSSISIFKQHGFFFKMDYPKFFSKYKSLSPKTWPSASSDFDIEELKAKIRCILAETKIDSSNHAFGKTEIFLKTPLDVAILIDRLEQIQEAVAVLIQRKYREVVHKRVRRKSEKIKVQLNNVNEKMYSEYGEHNVVQITNGKSISRLLLISKTNICFLQPDTYEMVFNFPLSLIYRLCMSRFSDGIFIICMRNFGDIILEVENKQHLYQDIESSYHKLMSSLLDSYKPISIEFHSIFYVNPSILVLEDNEMKQKAEYEIFTSTLPRNSNGDYQHQITLDSDESIPTESNYTVQFLKDFTIAAMKIERRPNNEGLIVYVKPNEDIYSGKKKRRQGSFDRYFVGDSLRWKEKLGEDRDILFSDLVDKYHKSFKKSERYLIITERSVYLEHKFRKKRRRIPLRKIYKISVSPFTDHYFFIHVKGESDVLLESIKKTEIISLLSNTVKATLTRVFEIDITHTITQVTKNPTLVRQVIFEEVQSPKSCRIEYTKASEPIKIYIHNEDVVDEFAKTILDVYGGKKSRRICSLKSAHEIEDAIFMREVLMSDNTTPLFVAEVEFVNPYTLTSVRKNMSISNSTIFLHGKKGSDGLRIENEEITAIKCSSQCDDLFVILCGESAYLFNSELKTKIIESLRAANSKIQIVVEPRLTIPFKDLFVWDGEITSSSYESLPNLVNDTEEPITPPSTPATHFLESPLIKKRGTNGSLIIVVVVDRNISEPKIMCNNEQANAKLTIRINDQDPTFPLYPLFSKSKKV